MILKNKCSSLPFFKRIGLVKWTTIMLPQSIIRLWLALKIVEIFVVEVLPITRAIIVRSFKIKRVTKLWWPTKRKQSLKKRYENLFNQILPIVLRNRRIFHLSIHSKMILSRLNLSKAKKLKVERNKCIKEWNMKQLKARRIYGTVIDKITVTSSVRVH